MFLYPLLTLKCTVGLVFIVNGALQVFYVCMYVCMYVCSRNILASLAFLHGTDIRCFRHLFSLNKWQYRDEHIIVIVALRGKMETLRLKNCKKTGMSGIRTMPGTLTTEPLDTWSLLLIKLT